WTWEGDGPAADWVVWMRRLDTNLAMDRMIREGRLTPSHRQQVADHLVTFYLSLPPATATARFYRDEIERHLRDNREALLSALPEHNHLVRKIHTLQLRTLRLRAEEFDHRVESHRVVEGHGDLRPEHIYLESPPAIIDCIEFSKAFRTIDVADELSFLDIECQALGNSTIVEQLLATWRHRSGDELPAWLLAFYGSYRACVRAKVAMLRQQQLDHKVQATPGAAKKYLQLADEL